MNGTDLLILGQFDFPRGMAGTKLIHHIIRGVKSDPSVSVRVMVLRQSLGINPPSGDFNGTLYDTLLTGGKVPDGPLSAPVLLARALPILRASRHPGGNDILFVYDSPSLQTLPIIRCARLMGFKVVFCFVEDHEALYPAGGGIIRSARKAAVRAVVGRTRNLADGIAAVSIRLQDKCREMTSGRVPLHYLPIMIDPEQTISAAKRPDDAGPVRLFYAGSFRDKDGLPFLLDAFDMLRRNGRKVGLVMTGAGSAGDKAEVLARIGSSPFKEDIDFRGYLDDAAYREALAAADILFMTRVDSEYANAGMPFKFGEFLAAGKPVVASRVSDVARFASDRVEAMLVGPGDAGEIAGAVEFLLDHPDEASAIGARGRARAIEAFDYRKNALGLLEFMRDL